ncbi:Protein CBG23186 [Caenorhabditis briggsae]|uniref:Glycosyltransferase family 92 protein n=1 Tax=Caenorhabditis briggsae TaxID=6238 RepID=A8Y4H8_CAEBR|nr:Protein CBG23186 [Caenorhabditis briggsae]CAP39798.2 Protein CBG23186 [Caenorhabditis briggsae]
MVPRFPRFSFKVLLVLLFALSVFILFYSVVRDASPEVIKHVRLNGKQFTHTFIHSAYYYPSSKSLGKNAVALVTTMNKRTVGKITDYKIKLVGTNRTAKFENQAWVSTYNFENIEHRLFERCDYLLITAQSNMLDNMEKLEIEAEGVLVEVPIKKPVINAPKPVIFCVSPQFAAEQWQTFLVQLHVSKKYGAHLHLYIVSMVESYFNLIREYQKMGLVSIEPWLTIKFPVTDGPYLEPNRNVELRNQAAAHTDCLLMYKEAASFVGILDMDDILIPTNANSYYEEFEREYSGDWLISALHYDKYDYKTIKVGDLGSQSLSAIVKNAERLPTKDTGKSFLRPERFNSTWSHWSRAAEKVPIYFDENGERLKEPVFRKLKTISNNGMFHLKNMYLKSLDELKGGEIPLNPTGQLAKMISDNHLNEIDEDMKKMLSLPRIAQLADTLPQEEFYMPIIFNCYNQSFYHLRDTNQMRPNILCVNAYSCDLPQREDMPCVHSDATYHSGPSMWPITYHFATNAFFSRDIGCYQ